jgi:hypothetical protein
MGHGIDVLEVATGLKVDLLWNPILNFGPVEIASIVGIDVYVAKIISYVKLKLA